VRPQRLLHLAQLDAEAAHLDLEVAAAHELQRPVGEPPPQVAGAVAAQPASGSSANAAAVCSGLRQ
jgi:hypothetical protein